MNITHCTSSLFCVFQRASIGVDFAAGELKKFSTPVICSIPLEFNAEYGMFIRHNGLLFVYRVKLKILNMMGK